MRVLAPSLVDHSVLLDDIEELVCVTDAQGQIAYVNRAWQDALGHVAPEGALGDVLDHVAAECRAVHRAITGRIVTGGPAERLDVVLVARDGRRVVASGRVRALHAASSVPGVPGEIVGTCGVYRDITHVRRGDAMRDRLAATLEASPDFVAVVTRDGRILFANAAARALVGMHDVREAQDVDGVMTPAEAARFRAVVVPAALADGRWSGESTLRTEDGTVIPVALMVIAHASTRGDDATPYFLSAIARDLRPERAATAALWASEVRYRSVVDALDEGVLVTESDGAGGGIVAACNASAEAILGLEPGTLRGRRDFWSHWIEVVDAAGEPFAADALPTPRTLRTGVAESGVVFGIRFADDVLRWIRASSRGLFREGAPPGALPYAVVTTFSDITTEREGAKQIAQFATAISMSPDGISVSRRDGTLIYTNAAHDQLYGYAPGELAGCGWQMLYEAEEIGRLAPSVFQALAEHGMWLGEAVGRRKDGAPYPQELRMRRLPWGGVVTAVRDISERKAYEATLHELSQRDELTGLFNRRGFFAHAERTLAQAAHAPHLLLYGDLDRFKAINDTRGHAAGDAALRAVARALREVFGPADVLGRLGGDEFVVLAAAGEEHVDALRSRLVAALARAAAQDTTALGGAAIVMSVGVAAFRPDGVEGHASELLPARLPALLKVADAELYAVKAVRKRARTA